MEPPEALNSLKLQKAERYVSEGVAGAGRFCVLWAIRSAPTVSRRLGYAMSTGEYTFGPEVVKMLLDAGKGTEATLMQRQVKENAFKPSPGDWRGPEFDPLPPERERLA